MNLLPEKKYRVPSWNFVEKNVLCEKGDEITRFDGTLVIKCKNVLLVTSLLNTYTLQNMIVITSSSN